MSTESDSTSCILFEIKNTPFFKDVKNGGLLNGIICGTERERLRNMVKNLKYEYDMGANATYLLNKYDKLSKNFSCDEIVKNWRNRFIKSINIVSNNNDKIIICNDIFFNLPIDQTTYGKLYIIEKNAKYTVILTNDVSEIKTNEHVTIIKGLKTKHDELDMVYKLMIEYGVANVRGSIYKSEKMNLNDANNAIKTIMHLSGDLLIVNENNIPDNTIIETFLLIQNNFSIKDVAEMKCLSCETIKSHINKSKKYNIHIKKCNNFNNYQINNQEETDDYEKLNKYEEDDCNYYENNLSV